LELSEAGMQLTLDRRDGNVDNEGIQHSDQRGCQHNGEHQPAPGIGLARNLC